MHHIRAPRMLAFLLLALATFASAAHARLFHRAIVDATGDVGYRPSIALDSLGQPHLAYYDKTNNALKYAVRLKDQWHQLTIDADLGEPLDRAFYTGILVDSGLRAHIFYYRKVQVREGWAAAPYTHILRYATNRSGVWVKEDVPLGIDLDQLAVNGSDASFTVAKNADGDLHVLHKENWDGALALRKRSISGWTRLSTISSGQNLDGAYALAFERNGIAHILYSRTAVDSADSKSWYVSNKSGGWQWEEVYYATTSGSGIAIDHADRPHMVVSLPKAGHIVYIADLGGASLYKTQIATAPTNVAGWCESNCYGEPALAIDSTDTLFSVFNRTPNYRQEQWSETDQSGGRYFRIGWGRQDQWEGPYRLNFDGAELRAADPKIAIDAADTLHIVYYDDQNGNLGYLSSPRVEPDQESFCTLCLPSVGGWRSLIHR